MRSMNKLFSRRALLIPLLSALLFLGLHAFAENKTFAVSKHPTCEMCHLTAEIPQGSSLFPEGTDKASVCLRCHDYRENHHPVDFVPAASDFTRLAKALEAGQPLPLSPLPRGKNLTGQEWWQVLSVDPATLTSPAARPRP